MGLQWTFIEKPAGFKKSKAEEFKKRIEKKIKPLVEIKESVTFLKTNWKSTRKNKKWQKSSQTK